MRPEYLRQRDRQPSALEQARARLQTREEAMRIAREEPALALEMGIGRPDRPGAMHAGLIDVNGAPRGGDRAPAGAGPGGGRAGS